MLDTLKQLHGVFPFFFTGVFFVFGAIVGSFLNVCILRLPRRESVVRPGSHCVCGAPIPFWNNIPIFSWLVLRGRAACCGRKFSVRYAAVEMLTGTLFALAWTFLPYQEAIVAMIFCSFALVLAFIDWDTMFLPDCVNAPFVLAGLACSFFVPELYGNVPESAGTFFGGLRFGFFPALVGLGVGSGAAYWLRYFASLLMRREALGEGDVILLGAIGAFCGWRGAIFAFFASSFLGISAVLVGRIFSKQLAHSERRREASHLSMEGDEEPAEIVESDASKPFPLGPWLLLGAVIYWVGRAGGFLTGTIFPDTFF